MAAPVTNPEVAIQKKCVHCDQEQYGLAVIGVSHGELGCTWCGKMSAAMTHDQWVSVLRTKIAMEPYPYTCVTCGVKPPDLAQLLTHLREQHPMPDDDT